MNLPYGRVVALTSNDETDLLLPLFSGMHETPRFRTFLERLRRRTGAEYVGLVLRQRDAPQEEETEFFAGRDMSRLIRETGIDEVHTIARVHHDRLRPGRVYAASDFMDHDPAYRDERERTIQRLGISDERVIRIVVNEGFSAFLIMAREKPCSAADSALISNLAPYVGACIRNFVAMEGQRVAAALSAEGLSRCGAGWILFDREARILAIDPATGRELERLAGITVRAGERLRDASPHSEREIAAATLALSGTTDSGPVALILCEEPRIEATLIPANRIEAAGMVLPATLALVRVPRSPSPARAGRLAQLFDLPRREAELAIALSDGRSIAEAAEAMGITIETARNYSKRIYAKLDVRGQAELVRLVYESAAILT